MSWPKVCGCGRVISKPSWLNFPALGLQTRIDDEPLDLRNCPGCGSTLAVPASKARVTKRPTKPPKK